MIPVTKAYLPPLEEYTDYLKKIWESGWITNHGPFVNELEEKLRKFFGVKHVFFVANGTVGLQLAIKSLGLKNEVITTPFSYVASLSSIYWENCKPVLADIDPHTLCLDPVKAEAAITPRTEAILAVHVYGNPCDTDSIGRLSEKYGIPVIYDAAHAFGVEQKKKSIVNCGNISVLSFHATKIFHTIEGGAVATNDDQLAEKIYYMRMFGHKGDEYKFFGINGKNSEVHAAMGLCILPRFNAIISRRKELSSVYDKSLSHSCLRKPVIREGTLYNYSYYPVIFPSEEILLQTVKELNDKDIYPRRYFYPPLNDLAYTGNPSLPVAEDISRRILCLPLYHDLNSKEVENISRIILKSIYTELKA